ncbi:MAG: extracellular solute-binding protein [Alphaproteobacteria bacterium]|nr:extracellular solute-binding protein [Pseudomonadota bacterium]TDI67816.1 MAG: extracellular solute-binding protein [Alphaproteobacteria bacterium]
MISKSFRFCLAALVGGAFATGAISPPAMSAELPKSTQEMLKNLKVDASILIDLDKALAVPKSLLDAANKEGVVRIGATHDPKQFRDFTRPFRERYPGVKVKYARSNRYGRVIKPLIAMKSGKVIVDLIMGFGGNTFQFEKLNALVNLTALPVYKLVPDFMKSPSGNFIGQRLLTRCFSYNTKKVKKADLPKTWEDIITSKRWGGRNLALLNRPDYWALHLWVTKGEAWTKNYLTKLFLETKPQLRKEGASAAVQLLGAGEFDGLIAGTMHRTSVLRKRGSPVGIHCPLPVTPTTVSPVGILKGGNENAAKLFVNWFLSREGQLAQFHSADYTPLYPDLVKVGLESDPGFKIDDTKRVYYREDRFRVEKALLAKHWDDLWFKRKGLKMRTVKVMIIAAKRGGRRYTFKVDGKDQKVRVSGSRTIVTVNGERTSRKAVKKGMTCTITYAGNDQTARSVACAK